MHEGKYWVLIEDAPFDLKHTPQLELQGGAATWLNRSRGPGTYEVEGETIIIIFEDGPSLGMEAAKTTIACSSMSDDYLSGDIIQEVKKAGAGEGIDVVDPCVLMRVGSASEAQVIGAQCDLGISWAELQETGDLVDEAEGRIQH